MKLDSNDNLPLYLQLKAALIRKVASGEYKPGNIIPTEAELCRQYGISRYPVRQAMDELVKEGYFERTRGKGTFVSLNRPATRTKASGRLALLLQGTGGRYSSGLLNGFEKSAGKHGYLTILHHSENSVEEELDGIQRVLDDGVDGIVIFPCDKSRLSERVNDIAARGVYLGIVDRNPGIQNIDYTNSDNTGGTYSAVGHMAMQGFTNTVFVSPMIEVSSLNERFEGYLKAVEDFGLRAITHINLEEDLRNAGMYRHRFLVEKLREELSVIKDNLPCGIFAANDSIALQCMKILSDSGLSIGEDVAIAGFDNEPEGEFAVPPLTTVEQNGMLIGSTAADIAIGKINGKFSEVYRTIIPTRLVIRKSCGEGRS